MRKALIKAGREDLIGFGKDCLVRPAPSKPAGDKLQKGKTASKPKDFRKGNKDKPKKSFDKNKTKGKRR